MSVLADHQVEAVERCACFGGSCTVRVQGSGSAGLAPQAAATARRRLEAWHRQFSRFDPESELSRVNGDPRETVPVSPAMVLFVKAALGAAALSGGLVDPTLVGELEQAGYDGDLSSDFVLLDLRMLPGRRPAAPNPASQWRSVSVNAAARMLTRPPGVRLDSGGIAKGLIGDLLAASLGSHAGFAVDASGDVRFGGKAGFRRPIRVASPFDDSILHTFELVEGAVATSGITRRSWRGRDGRPAHHLLDPATGKPAFTGVLQVTALAPTGTEAETLSKAALLSGSDRARGWLAHGGVVVYDDRAFEVVEPTDD